MAQPGDFKERSGDDPSTPWWGIHVARYEFGRRRLGERRRLLDVACGTGYGLERLVSQTQLAVGVDLDRTAVGEARRAGRTVVVADATRLPFREGCFDAITSFETIEHLEDRKGFVGEMRRVLADSGELVLSTPNAFYTRPVNGKPRNPYHVHEYEPGELMGELSSSFSSVTLFGQALGRHIVVSPFDEEQARLRQTPRIRARLLLWRVLNKLPARPRDRASHAIWGHQLYPGPGDYVFDEASAGQAPVLVAVGRR